MFAALRRKLSLKACAKAPCWAQSPWALAAASLGALPAAPGASASCTEALGAGERKPAHGCFWQHPALSLFMTAYLGFAVPHFLPCSPPQNKCLSWISVYLLVFGNLPWRCVGIRTGQRIRRNVSVKAAAGEKSTFNVFFLPPPQKQNPAKLPFQEMHRFALKISFCFKVFSLPARLWNSSAFIVSAVTIA